MKTLRFPLLWTVLFGMWLLLNGSLHPGQLVLGAIIATGATLAAAPVVPPRSRVRHLGTLLQLLGIIVVDVIKSNIAVLGLIISGRTPRSAFVEIPLDLTDENGLAILAIIVTATPGSAWVHHDSRRSLVTIHVLDTDDAKRWADDFKQTYERRLVEILQ